MSFNPTVRFVMRLSDKEFWERERDFIGHNKHWGY